MNLKLSRDSIRIRVELNEALELLNEGSLRESLPWGSKSLELRIETTKEEALRLDEDFFSSGLKLWVPRVDLKQLLVSHENRAPKAELELKVKAVLENRQIEVRFEIDRFIPKLKEMNL